MSNNLSIYIIYKMITLFELDFCVIRIPPNFRFNKWKNLRQPGKNIYLTLLKMPIKYNIFLLIHIFKTNLSKIYPKKFIQI